MRRNKRYVKDTIMACVSKGNSSPSVWRAIAVSVACYLLVCAAVARVETSQEPASRAGAPAKLPPWRRVLAGEFAAKVEVLEKRIDDLEMKGEFAEAIDLAGQVLRDPQPGPGG